ncbi:MAG: pentapeptide repeat-containing protein, partial [Rickettsiales bacterium]|nr:pentapeptide repeat-containing protein [Rickettsiales bacterium]
MPIDNAVKMHDRKQNFTEFRKVASSFENLLQNTDVLKFAHKNRETIKEIKNGSYILGVIKFIAKNLFSGDFWKIVFNAPTIYKIYQNYDKPEMQKLLVDETSLLEQVGKNNGIVKELLNDLVFTESDKGTTLLKQVTGATIDLLHDEKSRNALKIELANNYFKFSLNSFDRQSFIDNFVEYEKSQITNKIKDENDLMKLLKEKSNIRLGDSNYTLKNIIKSLEADATKTEISNALKPQLRKELNFLGLNDAIINTIIPDELVLSFQDAQKILQDNYDKVLNQKIVDIHNQIENDIKQSGKLNTFDNYVSNILREHAKYIVDVQEPLYQEKYIKDYIRFKQENDSTKSVDELREEAIKNSYNLAPDYMRLTQNVLRIVDSLPDQKTGNIIESASPNLKTVLRTSGKEIIGFAKEYIEIKASEETKNMLTGFGVTDEILDLAPLVLGEDGGIAKVANLTESIRTKFIFEWAEDTLNFLNSNAELQQKFKDSPKMASNLTKGIVNSIPFLKNLCQDLGCTDQVFDIISILLKTPEDTQKILGYLNKGKYVELVQKFIETAKSNEELRNYLTSHKDVYKKLVSSLFKEIDLMRDLKDKNGITNEALGEILDSTLSILDEPTKFKALIDVSNQIFNTINKYIADNALGEFSNLQKEDYIKLAKTILQSEALFKLLDENKVALGNFVELLVSKIPTLRAVKQNTLAEIDIRSTLNTLINRDILRHERLISNIADAIKTGNTSSFIKLLPRHLIVAIQKGPKILLQYLSSPSVKEGLAALIKAQINSNTSHNSLGELLQGAGNTDLTNLGKTKDLSGIVLDDPDFSKIKNIQGFTFVGSNFTKSNFANIEVQNSSFVNSVFQKGVSFAGSELQDVDFSNAKFSGYQIEELYLPRRTQTTGKIEKDAKISFKNAILKNVNFSNISLIKSAHSSSDTLKIYFEGAVIDRLTFISLVNAIRVNPSLQNDINLRGAKIIGDLSELDLSGINLAGLDLSAVSNLKGTIVKGANLKGTNINSELLKQALQLEGLQIDLAEDALNEIEASQKQNKELIIIGKISKLIVDKLIRDGKLLVKDAIEITLLIERLNTKLLTELDSLEEGEKEFLYNLFEKNYANLDQFTLDPNTIKHYSDFSDKQQVILHSLYDKAFLGATLTDQNLANALKYENMKNLIADEISKKLFGSGQNRGKDFIIIREHLSKVFNQLSPEEKQNLYTSICTTDSGKMVLNASPECEILINSLKEQYYTKTKYTTAGVVTSGIYLPTKSVLDEFITSNLNKIKVISDLAKIKELSEVVGQKIGQKLFGDAMSSSRQADVKKIIAYFNDQIFPHILCQLPKDEKQALLDNIDYNKDELVNKLVGDFNKVNMLGMSKVHENSLSQVFYNSTSYTKTGTVVGGIQLDTTKLNSQDFFDSVADCVMGKCKSDLSQIEELAKKIGNRLGEKLFGDSTSSSRKEDVTKIINTLNKVVLPYVIKSLSDGQQKENFLKANDETINSLVGNFTPSGIWGKKITEPISLAQIFYDNSSYTKVGLVSGGIQINDSKLTDRS